MNQLKTITIHHIIAVRKSPSYKIQEITATDAKLSESLAILEKNYETVFVSHSRKGYSYASNK